MPNTLEADLELSELDVESVINSDTGEQVLQLVRQARMSQKERTRTAVTLPV